MVGSPDFPDIALMEKHETRGIHVGELVAAQDLELASHLFMMSRLETEKLQARQIRESQPECSGGFLTQAMKEPAVRLPDDGDRGVPAPRRIGEETDGRLVIAVAPVEKRDEDPGIEKDGSRSPLFRAAAGRRLPR
jgi:hypothetical protein